MFLRAFSYCIICNGNYKKITQDAHVFAGISFIKKKLSSLSLYPKYQFIPPYYQLSYFTRGCRCTRVHQSLHYPTCPHSYVPTHQTCLMFTAVNHQHKHGAMPKDVTLGIAPCLIIYWLISSLAIYALALMVLVRSNKAYISNTISTLLQVFQSILGRAVLMQLFYHWGQSVR